MSKIYLVLTYTGTILSRIVRGFTRDEFTHVSIALDEELNHMYSFGRLNPYNPFIGGFVHESIEFGTFKRFHKTKTKIYSMEVDQKQYETIKKVIKDIKMDKTNYRFNIIGLIGVLLHYKVKREKCFYCAEFVKYVLDNSNMDIDLPDVIKPIDFQNIQGIEEVYSGVLKNYKLSSFDKI